MSFFSPRLFLLFRDLSILMRDTPPTARAFFARLRPPLPPFVCFSPISKYSFLFCGENVFFFDTSAPMFPDNWRPPFETANPSYGSTLFIFLLETPFLFVPGGFSRAPRSPIRRNFACGSRSSFFFCPPAAVRGPFLLFRTLVVNVSC